MISRKNVRRIRLRRCRLRRRKSTRTTPKEVIKNARTAVADKRSEECQAAPRGLADARRTLQPGASDAGGHASRRARRPFGGKDFCGNELRACDSRGKGKWLGNIARGTPSLGKRLRGLGVAHLRGEKSGGAAPSSVFFAPPCRRPHRSTTTPRIFPPRTSCYP